MKLAKLLLASSLAAMLLVAPAPAMASEALDHYTKGRESYHAGLYGRALEEFEKSLASAPSPNTRLYIARTLRELGRWSEAAEQYRVTIQEADERGGKYAAARDAADMELRDVNVRLERGATSRSEPSSASPVPVPVTRPSGDGPSTSTSTSTSPSRDAPARRPTPLTWASGGVAVAGVASFAVLYALASDRHGYLEDNCTQVRDAACDDARVTGKTEETVAYVALGVGVVAAALAVVSLVAAPSSSTSSTSSAMRVRARREMGPWRLAF